LKQSWKVCLTHKGPSDGKPERHDSAIAPDGRGRQVYFRVKTYLHDQYCIINKSIAFSLVKGKCEIPLNSIMLFCCNWITNPIGNR
jgi:hypothetical protein